MEGEEDDGFMDFGIFVELLEGVDLDIVVVDFWIFGCYTAE